MSPSHPKKRARLGGAVDETAGDGSSSADLVNDAPLLERLAADARDVLDAHLLSRLDDGDRAMLALVSQNMRDVIFTSSFGEVKDLAAVRTELGRVRNFVGSIGRLAWAKERGCPWNAKTFKVIAKGGNVEVAKWAKERGCPWDVKVVCNSAAFGGHLEMLRWLRTNGAPWTAKALSIAAREGHVAVVEAMVAAGADVNKADKYGVTPLYFAALEGHVAVVEALVAARADVNKADVKGETPLYIAARNGHEAVVEALVDAGADVNKAMNDGATPLYAAKKYNALKHLPHPSLSHTEGRDFEAVIKLLEAAGAK
jgi:hypothetical protein